MGIIITCVIRIHINLKVILRFLLIIGPKVREKLIGGLIILLRLISTEIKIKIILI